VYCATYHNVLIRTLLNSLGAELWWQGQKDRLRGIQLIVNRQARTITGMLRTTPLGPLIREAGLYLAEALLDRRQRQYTLRVLGLPRGHPATEVSTGKLS
jgi:hypothetical protein